mmetsp:Transcript_38991/g.59317  ORF Transcript_38991/g.59317 Transcript_38991/m.59317 type:complete len:82 (+) Transcript_38991:2730-2975(+)
MEDQRSNRLAIIMLTSNNERQKKLALQSIYDLIRISDPYFLDSTKKAVKLSIQEISKKATKLQKKYYDYLAESWEKGTGKQ